MNSFTKINLHAEENFFISQKAVSEGKPGKVFHIAKPILLFLSRFVLIPSKVRMILGHLVEVLDALYPEANDETLSNPSGSV